MEKVFYFSGTGNSLFAAKSLAEDPISVVTVKPGKIAADSIGIVFPVHCWSIPKPVKEFVEKNEFDAPYIWAVATYGGGPGGAFYDLDKLLARSGGLSYYNGVTLPDNDIIFPTPDTQKVKQLFEAPLKLAKIKKDIEAKEIRRPGFKLLSGVRNRISWAVFKNLCGIKVKRADNKCTQCEICVKMCPTDNIKLENGKIVFGDKCVYCFGCIQYCPANAIHFGSLARTEKTAYTNRNIKPAEMITRNKKL
jgi:Ferredoxin